MILEGLIVTDGSARRGWLEIEGEFITATGDSPAADRTATAKDPVIAPGLIDLQVNGATGAEVTDGSQALAAIDRHMLAHGITGYLPTIITTDVATAQRALDDIASKASDPASPILGAHLEGPFLNPAWRGVHRADLLALPQDGVPAYYEHPAVKLVTLAPELPGAIELCAKLAERGVKVAAGHTAATGKTLAEAAEAGVTLTTHLFNAMPRFHHRDPGPAGWILSHDELTPSVIADGQHLADDALRLTRRAREGRVILVSDASTALGTAPGSESTQAGRAVHLDGDDGGARTRDGDLAGGAAALDECVERWAAVTEAPLPDALEAASTRPARALGLDCTIAPGKPADLVLFDQSGRLLRTMRHGRWIS